MALRHLSLYNVCNTLLIGSYLYIRTLFRDSEVRLPGTVLKEYGNTKEIEFTSMALLYLLARYRQYNSFDEMLDRAFFMGKALVLLMLYMTDTAVALRWAVIAALCYFLIKKPAYSGAAECRHLTAGGLDSDVMSAPEDQCWLVLYTASWNSDCQYVFPLFAELSALYSSEHLKFGTLDAGRWPEAAEVAHISTEALSPQIPSVVLYRNGAEVKRMPPLDASGKSKRVRMDTKSLLRYFQMQALKEGDVSAVLPPKPCKGEGANSKAKGSKKTK